MKTKLALDEANAGIPAYRKPIDLGGKVPVKHAAGVLHISPAGEVLLLHRARNEGNFPGHWALPGGGVEDGEAPEFGARRECVEEMGTDAPDGPRKLLHQKITPTGMGFHTFVQPVTDTFAPKLNGEHSGYTWAPLYDLPQPMHPAVEELIHDHIGVPKGMSEDAFEAVRDDFLKWASEENQEIKVSQAHDALPLALDRDSVRTIDDEGRLHVSRTPICKACVSPYLGSEIPNFEELGLDAAKTYYLLRDPEELQKSISTFNNLPLLRKHLPTSADDHPQAETVGMIGSVAQWEDPYITNSAAIWVGEDVEGVASKLKRELSPGYKYTADMTPGNYRGTRFDGVMRNISGNHVALVETGRQGPDVVVGDSAESILMDKKIQAIVARAGTIGALCAFIKPRLAMDAKIEIAPLFKDVTGKKFAADVKPISIALDAALKGKLGKDAGTEGLAALINACAKGEESHDEVIEPATQAAMETSAAALPVTVPPPAIDETGPIKEFLKGKGMSEDDIGRVCDMLPKGGFGKDEDKDEESEEEKAKRLAAKDEKDDDKDKDEKDMGNDKPISRSAMDEALKTTAATVRQQVIQEQREVSAARELVKPIVGELSSALALDSAEQVFRHVLKMKGVANHDTLPAAALSTIVAMLPKPNIAHDEPHLALDAAQTENLTTRFPGMANIRPAP